ncbi:MAG: GNAT family N-acetyltransferase [Coprobacillus sp.]
MKIYKAKDKKEIEELFNGWQETMIYSCLQGYMGEAYATDDHKSAMIIIADFCFMAGKPSQHLLESLNVKNFMILVPQNERWNSVVETVYPQSVKRIRYATRKDINHFDVSILKQNVSKLLPCYSLKVIDESIYHQILDEDWSSDLCGQFATYQEYLKNGIGFVIMENQEIVAGVSSYTVYKDGLEIEIDTRKDKRRQGLARVCASQMILECLSKNLYPSWDAHNEGSLKLAESLGYVFDKTYFVYEVIEN